MEFIVNISIQFSLTLYGKLVICAHSDLLITEIFYSLL